MTKDVARLPRMVCPGCGKRIHGNYTQVRVDRYPGNYKPPIPTLQAWHEHCYAEHKA